MQLKRTCNNTLKNGGHVHGRITIMHIKTKIQGETMNIRNTHAPEIGDAIDIRGEYWAQIDPILYRKIKDFLLLATENNGKVRRRPDTDGKIIGKWTTATETDKGNGEK